MVCPFCLHKKTDVYNTRSTDAGMTVWRRRRCLNCKRPFTTEERMNPSGLWTVVGKDAHPYSRAKLAMSLVKVCDHRDHQDDTAWYLYEAVERKLAPIAAKNHLLTTDQITEAAAGILKNFDAAAYIKYLSYHQSGLDVKSLRKHLRRG